MIGNRDYGKLGIGIYLEWDAIEKQGNLSSIKVGI